MIGGFNKTQSNNINTTEGLNLFSLMSSDGFSQLIHEPTYIQANSSSCIDLVFTDQPNLSVNAGVHASLHPNYHHQIVHSNFNPVWMNEIIKSKIKTKNPLFKQYIQKWEIRK